MKKITIVGAGLAGSLLAVYLSKKGYSVDVYERRPDMRKHNIGGGKSINLALSTRGIHALKEVGLYDDIKKIAIPMFGRMIHPLNGELNFQRYGKDDSEYINAVSRGELNKSLMDLAEKNTNVKIHFSERCDGIDFNKSEISLFNDEKKSAGKVNYEILIATDGATSAIRMEMLKIPRFNFSQQYENYGYKELIIPADDNGKFKMNINSLHIWPRGSFMLIALPNLDGSYTCTLFLAYDMSYGGENSFEFLNSPERVSTFFEANFPDFVNMHPDYITEFFQNPVGTLMTVKCFPWIVNDNAAMLGDACHAIVPFFGQGMNAAFEDCVYLNSCIDKYGNDWKKIFEEYQMLRKENSDAIADLARENFIEMRDLVTDNRFLLKKKIETELYKKYPDSFIPKYTMVTFMRIPYSAALQRGKIQENILSKLSENLTDISGLDYGLAEILIRENLGKLHQ